MRKLGILWFSALILAIGCAQPLARTRRVDTALSAEARAVVESAKAQTRITTSYDPSYVTIAYPGGDVPETTGACTDVVIRAFRAAGVDLQKAVHEDMARAFSRYPRRWGLSRPDTNIDHRRVPNLMVFFDRAGRTAPATTDTSAYLPGDVVAWDLGGGVTHIGLVVDEADTATSRPLVVHNIGYGARKEDVLFEWRIIGHYRYFR